ncbi:MAG: carbon-nitrogen hydrolase family protein [Nitrosarchaeum sp.]|nr:carbon-nitrogen hydrolase family protein [Nitrosarchaeum sp.]
MVKIGIIQTRSYKTNQEGINAVSKLLRRIGKKGANIVCLPEQWLQDNHISDYDEEFSDFKEIAREFSMTIIPGAFYERVGGKLVISAPVIGPKGTIIGRQEKIHPFDYERNIIKPGKEAKIFNTACKFGIVICYDMVFPNVSNVLTKKGAHVLVSPSRIVKRGITPWSMYVQVRALENRIPILGANVTNSKYGGNSIIVDLLDKDNVVIPKITRLKGESAIVKEFDLSKYTKIRKARFSDSKKVR